MVTKNGGKCRKIKGVENLIRELTNHPWILCLDERNRPNLKNKTFK